VSSGAERPVTTHPIFPHKIGGQHKKKKRLTPPIFVRDMGWVGSGRFLSSAHESAPLMAKRKRDQAINGRIHADEKKSVSAPSIIRSKNRQLLIFSFSNAAVDLRADLLTWSLPLPLVHRPRLVSRHHKNKY